MTCLPLSGARDFELQKTLLRKPTSCSSILYASLKRKQLNQLEPGQYAINQHLHYNKPTRLDQYNDTICRMHPTACVGVDIVFIEKTTDYNVIWCKHTGYYRALESVSILFFGCTIKELFKIYSNTDELFQIGYLNINITRTLNVLLKQTLGPRKFPHDPVQAIKSSTLLMTGPFCTQRH